MAEDRADSVVTYLTLHDGRVIDIETTALWTTVKLGERITGARSTILKCSTGDAIRLALELQGVLFRACSVPWQPSDDAEERPPGR